VNITSIRIVSIGGRDLYSGYVPVNILRVGGIDGCNSIFELINVCCDSMYEFE
jgi:hypothetical protein